MLLFKINSHKKQYFDDYLNGYSLAVTFADWLTGLVFHTVAQTLLRSFLPPSVVGWGGFKQLLCTSSDFYIKFREIITYHSIGIYSDMWSLLHVSKQKSEFCEST